MLKLRHRRKCGAYIVRMGSSMVALGLQPRQGVSGLAGSRINKNA
ncbi:MAG: hypothetical protein V4633_08295 [Pseudomonadota bacterium]